MARDAKGDTATLDVDEIDDNDTVDEHGDGRVGTRRRPTATADRAAVIEDRQMMATRDRDQMFQISRRVLFWGIVAITVIGFFLRLWDLGERALHHDESLDAWWSRKYIDGTYNGYDPVFHGPLRFYITGAFYLIFGESPAVARLFAALSGALLVAVPWFMRKDIGRVAALASAAFLCISPSMLYFSRFGREDAQIMFLTGAMIAMAVVFVRKPNPWLPPAFALAMSASFAIKESTYLWLGIVGSFGVVLLAVQYERAAREGSGNREDWVEDRPLSVFDFDVAMPLLGLLGLLFAVIIGNQDWVPGGVFLMLGLYGAALMGTMVVQAARANAAGVGPFDVPITRALKAAGGTSWILAGALFVISFLAFFTVWFTRPGDWHTGVTEAISYWRSQQDVNRGGQPWYYYLVALPAYEWLFIILAGFGAKRAWRVRDFTHGLLIWTALASLILYSYAGERMPWLFVHPMLPVLFLAGIGVQEIWSSRSEALTKVLLGVLLAGFAFTVFTSLRASFVTDTDGRELFVQAGQATEHVTELLDEIDRLDRISRAEFGRPLALGIGADDAWPWAYYLQDYAYSTWDGSNTPEAPTELDVFIVNNYVGRRGDFFDPAIEMPNHQSTRFALRVWWVPANVADENGNFTPQVSYFDTGEDRLLPTRIVEWVDWVITKDADWDFGIGGGCGSVDQYFLVSNDLLAAAARADTGDDPPQIDLLPCASNEMSYNPRLG